MTLGKLLEGRYRRSKPRQKVGGLRWVSCLYLKEIAGHIPLTTIGNEVFGSMTHFPMINWEVRVLYSHFQIVVRFLQFIIYEQVTLERMLSVYTLCWDSATDST